MAETEYPQRPFVGPPGSTNVFLVRHGASEPAVPGRSFPLADGHGDPALAPEGREQAERVAARLADEHIDAIYVTTLRRTHETAAPLAARLGLEPVVEADLREVHLGEWEGGSFRQHVAEGHPTALRAFAEERWDVIPGAEPQEAFSARVRAGIDRVVARSAGRRIAIFTHGGVIGELLRLASESSRGFVFATADNASISHLLLLGDRWLVRRFNDTSHHPGGLDRPEPADAVLP
ncbi:MAG TPA: histidine phosphatase family protein [Acidimicrobiales bacterium]|nr:histidine phosphatase family protein [Acidimicrobiales bacterium]